MNKFQKLLFVTLCVIFLSTTGCGNTLKKVGDATVVAMYFVVMVPIAIIGSPIALAKVITDKNDSKITKSEDGNSIGLKQGESKDTVLILLGNPDEKYYCENPRWEIWAYDKIEDNRFTYMVFDVSDKIQFFTNSWVVSDTCKPLK